MTTRVIAKNEADEARANRAFVTAIKRLLAPEKPKTKRKAA